MWVYARYQLKAGNIVQIFGLVVQIFGLIVQIFWNQVRSSDEPSMQCMLVVWCNVDEGFAPSCNWKGGISGSFKQKLLSNENIDYANIIWTFAWRWNVYAVVQFSDVSWWCSVDLSSEREAWVATLSGSLKRKLLSKQLPWDSLRLGNFVLILQFFWPPQLGCTVEVRVWECKDPPITSI